ncbi:MAG: NAD-dependent epimerase/dehydratase family protein [Spirochaetes bacterium]|nr:NAD-dependent epimerase/dehydratase family protein [Spirochaetota bacterium]
MTPADFEGKKILITGGLGFIGSNLAHRALALGAEVTVYDCLDPKSGGNHYNLEGVRDRVRLVINDVRNFEALCQAVLHQDLVLHCAAYTSHPNSMREPLVDIDINCKGTIHVLEAVRRFQPSARVLYVGTSTQIGPMHAPVIDEVHSEFPVDIYSANKCAGEKYTLLYGKAHGLDVAVVRLANTYGPRSNIRSADFGFINYFIGLALAGRALTVYGEGRQLRNVSFVGDSVEALLSVAARPASRGEVYFAVADRQYSVLELAQAITEQVGGSVARVPWPAERAAIESGDVIISNAKIRRDVGWVPRTSLHEGLGITRDYFKPVLAKYA